MSRDKSVQLYLDCQDARVVSVNPTGDCFYECIVEAFNTVGKDLHVICRRPRKNSTNDDANQDDGDSLDDLGYELTPVSLLRRTASAAVTEDVYENFVQFHMAGLPDFAFMRRCRSREALQHRMLVTGRNAGAGQCLWANEFEIGAVSTALGLRCLILDMQSRDANSRFISIGAGGNDEGSTNEELLFVILQRSRREHYNLITIEGKGLFRGFGELPDSILTRWRLVKL